MKIDIAVFYNNKHAAEDYFAVDFAHIPRVGDTFPLEIEADGGGYIYPWAKVTEVRWTIDEEANTASPSAIVLDFTDEDIK